jgi:hypothetical protein
MMLLSLMPKILSNFEVEICYCGLSGSMPLLCEYQSLILSGSKVEDMWARCEC